MSPLSETLWRSKTNTGTVGDTSARLTWVDLWVTIFRGGSKQAILQGLTGKPKKNPSNFFFTEPVNHLWHDSPYPSDYN
jgi:hypothetical protein